MVKLIWVFFTLFTDKNKLVAGWLGAILIVARLALAMNTLSDNFGVVREIDRHTVIEDAQATFP